MKKGNILFDLDNTLTDYDYTNRHAIKCVYDFMNRDLTEEEFNRYREFEINYWKTFESTNQEIDSHGMDRIDYVRSHLYQELFKDDYIPLTLGYDLMKIYIDNQGIKNLVYENVPETLEYLYEYYDLYIASNGPFEAQKRKLFNSELDKYFKGIITAELAGYSKPSPKFYEYLYNKLDIDPSNTTLIGDSITSDIKGANEQGMNSIWYNPNGLINRTDIQPNYEIRNMKELKKIL